MAENQKGTFIVKINHTDNASWQGQVTWADKNITKKDRKSTRLNSSHRSQSRMPSSA